MLSLGHLRLMKENLLSTESKIDDRNGELRCLDCSWWLLAECWILRYLVFFSLYIIFVACCVTWWVRTTRKRPVIPHDLWGFVNISPWKFLVWFSASIFRVSITKIWLWSWFWSVVSNLDCVSVVFWSKHRMCNLCSSTGSGSGFWSSLEQNAPLIRTQKRRGLFNMFHLWAFVSLSYSAGRSLNFGLLYLFSFHKMWL